MNRIGHARQRGMALVLVLWLIVLLAVMAAGHSRNTHIETRLAARHVDASAARHVAEAGVHLAILDLIEIDDENRIDTSGQDRPLKILGRDTIVSIRRAAGLVDLNAADAGPLSALFAALSGDATTSRQLANAVLDWRDGDDLVRINGAESSDYRVAGLYWSPRNAPFQRAEELQYVLGMTGELYRAALPYVTVHSGQSGVDLDAAPEFLIRALSAASIAMPTNTARPPLAGTGTYHITVSVRGASDTLVSVEAVVNISGSRDRHFELLEWREHARALPDTGEDTTA